MKTRAIVVSALVGIFIGILMTCLMGCSTPLTAPTEVPKPVVRTVSYTINIPYLDITTNLRNTYPGGIEVPPVDAQSRWNYTDAYLGSPNAYFGPLGPCNEYWMTGIAVAPVAVASKETFTSIDWPLMEVGYTYRWVGIFTYAVPAPPGTSIIDPSCPR